MLILRCIGGGTGIWAPERCRIEEFAGASTIMWTEAYQEDITKVIISEEIETIGEYSFDHSTALTEITIPSTVKVIGDYAFRGCVALTTINYAGTAEDWALIEIGDGNDKLSELSINYVTE